MNGIYRIFYYKYYRGVQLVSVPVKIDAFGVTLLDMEEDDDSHVKASINDDDDDDIGLDDAFTLTRDEDDNHHSLTVELTEIKVGSSDTKKDTDDVSPLLKRFKIMEKTVSRSIYLLEYHINYYYYYYY